ncbi:hypothetical protein BaRGS_00028891 [Batillaria attramentaria]|uniref:Uncharacterized protein n=1 Tax=Batillaria attramentaria TaxID=370345 RepID=A0ABD0JXX4_9CAEN
MAVAACPEMTLPDKSCVMNFTAPVEWHVMERRPIYISGTVTRQRMNGKEGADSKHSGTLAAVQSRCAILLKFRNSGQRVTCGRSIDVHRTFTALWVSLSVNFTTQHAMFPLIVYRQMRVTGTAEGRMRCGVVPCEIIPLALHCFPVDEGDPGVRHTVHVIPDLPTDDTLCAENQIVSAFPLSSVTSLTWPLLRCVCSAPRPDPKPQQGTAKYSFLHKHCLA